MNTDKQRVIMVGDILMVISIVILIIGGMLFNGKPILAVFGIISTILAAIALFTGGTPLTK